MLAAAWKDTPCGPREDWRRARSQRTQEADHLVGIKPGPQAFIGAAVIGQAIRASAWKWAAIGCAVLAVASMGAAGIQTIRLSSAQTAIANMARQSVAEQFATSEAYRAEEWMRARYIAGTSAAYEEGKARAKAAADGIVADVRAGRYVLRESLRCPASPAAEATAGPGVSDGSAAPRGGVDGEDVQFLIRFAEDAELVSEQLRACQAVIRADRVQIK